VYAFQSRALEAGRIEEDNICPFCRTPPASSYEGNLKRLEKRMGLNDADAIYSLGNIYEEGSYGLRPNQAKALELWHRAAELGYAPAYHNLSCSYRNGRGVEVDEKKARHYLEIAAMKGSGRSRHNLGVIEAQQAGNARRAVKHFMIAARDGVFQSVKNIKEMYEKGFAAKADYAEALRSYQAYLDEIKSEQRDGAAAAADDDYKYYD